MPNAIMQGASAPGPVTPCRSDEPAELGSVGGFGGQEREDSLDSASDTAERKLIAGLAARAALLGVEVHRLADGTWLLRARGVHIGIVRGADALGAAVAGVEAAHADVRELVHGGAAA